MTHKEMIMDKRWWYTDPVPPWIVKLLDDNQLRELAAIQLKRQIQQTRLSLETLEMVQKMLG